jgi:hypothetical protein
MQELAPPPTRRDTRLALTLRKLAIEPWELVELARARSCLEASPTLHGAICRWANDSKSTRRHLPDLANAETLTELCVLAGSSLTARPLVYVASGGQPLRGGSSPIHAATLHLPSP